MAATLLCRMLPRLHHNLKHGVLYFPSAGYARGNRGSFIGDDTIGGDHKYNSSKEIKMIDEELIDEIEDMGASDSGSLVSKVIQEQEGLKYKILRKTIERKYFKPPQEPNLLTWDAKEQVRYLNQEYPNEWTPEILAECFPVTREGVINILKSTFVPRTLKEVVKHDKRVQNNWLALKRKKKDKALEAGPLVSHYQKLLNEGKDWTFLNATGIKELPIPERRYLIESGGNHKEKKVGTFESIIKDYVDQKNAKEQGGEKLKEREMNLIEQHEHNNVKMLESFTKSTLSIGKENLEKGTKESDSIKPSEDFDYKKYFQTKGLNKDIGSEVSAKKTREKSLLDVAFLKNNVENSQRHSERKNENISSRLTHQHKLDEVYLEKLEDLQQYGTGTCDSQQDMVGSDNIQPNSDTRHQTRNLQYSNVVRNNELKEDDIVYESRGDSGRIDAYMYNSESGYQYPYGKKDNTPQNIPVPPQKANEEKVFKKGKTYYDDDGEFLYRTP